MPRFSQFYSFNGSPLYWQLGILRHREALAALGGIKKQEYDVKNLIIQTHKKYSVLR
jgi:hypothetical protein